MSKLVITDIIEVHGLKARIEGFTELNGVKMVSTKFGDFHPDLVIRAEDKICKNCKFFRKYESVRKSKNVVIIYGKCETPESRRILTKDINTCECFLKSKSFRYE